MLIVTPELCISNPQQAWNLIKRVKKLFFFFFFLSYSCKLQVCFYMYVIDVLHVMLRVCRLCRKIPVKWHAGVQEAAGEAAASPPDK